MSKRSAAWAHWFLRCWVGTTTTTRRAFRAISARQTAASAKLVFPAPGVATARKSRSDPSNAARASRCQGRRRRLGAGEAGVTGEACWVATVRAKKGRSTSLNLPGRSVDSFGRTTACGGHHPPGPQLVVDEGSALPYVT